MKELFAWVDSVRPAAVGGTWEAIVRGGSDRRFWRGGGVAAGLVLVHYGTEKAENARYADCAQFLNSCGVNVPRMLAHAVEERFLLLEDAGVEDLGSYQNESWEVRSVFYRQALTQGAALHACDLAKASAARVLQGPFDEELYTWEQNYFREHFLQRPMSKESSKVLKAQAAELARGPRVLVHRDFQSQNIMVREGAVKLIDFQGMRAGRAAYDVASLLYDPYVDMTQEERMELADFYAQLTGRSNQEAWREELRACARQRLMQALGAYGFLGRVKGRPSFLASIPVAAARLAALCDEETAWQPLAHEVCQAALI